MAILDDELRIDAEENAREIEFIRKRLPADLKDKYSDADLLFMLDAIVDYYFESGVLEAQPDDEGYVDIDMQAVADHVCKVAAEEHHKELDPSEVFFVAEADMDFQEQNA